MNQDLQTSNLSQEDLELNQQLGLKIPEGEVESEDNSSVWDYYFRLVRYMYRAGLVSVENIPKFTQKLQNSPDRNNYLAQLKDYIGEKIDENKILNNIIKQDEITLKLKQALEIIPAENAAQFIGEIFNGNPPASLLKELNIVVQELPQFTPEEIELLQEAKLQDILNQSKRRPLNASNLVSNPGFNKPFTPEDIGNIVDQFGKNYDQVQLQKQAAERAKANQPFIPGRYQVNQPQNNSNSQVLSPIQAQNHALPQNDSNSELNNQNTSTTSQVRAMPAKKVILNKPVVSASQNPSMNPNYPVNRPQMPNSQPNTIPSQFNTNQQRQPINNPVFNPQRQARPIPVNNPNFRPSPGISNAAQNNFIRPQNQPVGQNNPSSGGIRNASGLPHKDVQGLDALLGG